MTRRQFLIILAGAADERSREIARALYAKQPHRGERDRAKLAPVAPKAPKKRRKCGEITQG